MTKEEAKVYKEKLKTVQNLGIPDLVVPELSQEEQKLLETPVDELPENLLFAPIPLEARIVEGVESIQQLNRYQR